MKLWTLAAVAVVGTTAAAEVGAQGMPFVPTISEGDTLKVWATAPRLNGAVGVLASLRADTLSLAGLPGGGPPVITAMVPYAALRRIDVRRGKHRSSGRIAIGTLLGAAAGGLIGAVAGPAIECRNSCSDLGGVAGFLIGTGVGAAAGGLTGGILGARRVVKWEAVAVRR